MLVVEPGGRPALLSAPEPPRWVPEGACPESVRFASPGGREVYAVWWSSRADGSAALLGARSDDGGERWTVPVPVDTTDRGRLRCDRPPPAITADRLTGYVHVAYFLEGPHGPGVFFSHSMERAELFHAPMLIVYGERPSHAAIASDGRTVTVAFQDPNTVLPRISLAISHTDGHLFEQRVVRISPASVAAEYPHVGVRGRTVAVGWTTPGARADRMVVRVGVARD